MSWRLGLYLLLMMIGGIGAHQAQRAVDPSRMADNAVNRRVFVPSPKATKVASLGFDMVVADMLWVRAVLLFVDFLEADGDDGATWTRTVLQTVAQLDPGWRTPFFYGGSMLRLLEDIEGSDEIFADGMAAFPEDAYFPFSIAMNAYLVHKDMPKAVKFLKRAADLPNAPRWYRTAAAEFISREGQRKAALMYLKQQIQEANSEKERVLLENKYKSLLYDQVIEVLEARQDKWEAHYDRSLQRVQALSPLPPDPLGGVWMIAPDGRIRSSIKEPIVALRAKNEERSILVNP